MRANTFNHHSEAYKPLLMEIVEHGEDVEVRGRPTREILNNLVEFRDPGKRCLMVPGRRWNPWIAISEAMWIFLGSNRLEYLTPYNSNISQFSDDGEILTGAYGYRIKDSLWDAIELLEEDISSRRAVVPIFDASDLLRDSKDIPCNTSIMFKARQGKLHMTVTNRSNDIHWGLFAVNLSTFSMVQELVANQLGLTLGTQTHLSQSLHVYTDNIGKAITDGMLYNWTRNFYYPEDRPHPMFSKKIVKEQLIGLAYDVLNGSRYEVRVEDIWFNFARKFLSIYRDNPRKKDKLEALRRFRRDGQLPRGFEDWMVAGELFLLNE